MNIVFKIVMKTINSQIFMLIIVTLSCHLSCNFNNSKKFKEYRAKIYGNKVIFEKDSLFIKNKVVGFISKIYLSDTNRMALLMINNEICLNRKINFVVYYPSVFEENKRIIGTNWISSNNCLSMNDTIIIRDSISKFENSRESKFSIIDSVAQRFKKFY